MAKIGQVYKHFVDGIVENVVFLGFDPDAERKIVSRAQPIIEYYNNTSEPNFELTKKTVAVFKKKRSDDFVFFLTIWSKKAVTVSAGCQGQTSVKEALEFWCDDHKVVAYDPEDEDGIERRRKLNRESRKIVLTLCKKAGVRVPKGDWA